MNARMLRQSCLVAFVLAAGSAAAAKAQITHIGPGPIMFGKVDSPWYSYEYLYILPGTVTYGPAYPQVPFVYGPQAYGVPPYVPHRVLTPLPARPYVKPRPPVQPPAQSHAPPRPPGRFDGRGYRSRLLARIKHPTPALAPPTATGEPNNVATSDPNEPTPKAGAASSDGTPAVSGTSSSQVNSGGPSRVRKRIRS